MKLTVDKVFSSSTLPTTMTMAISTSKTLKKFEPKQHLKPIMPTSNLLLACNQVVDVEHHYCCFSWL
jgi:hypothetical protein